MSDKRHTRSVVVEKHLEENPPVPGTVFHVELRHDEWCAIWAAEGPCDCQPDVVTGPLIDRKYGG